MASNNDSKLIDIDSPNSSDTVLQFQDFALGDSSNAAKLDVDASYSPYPSKSTVAVDAVPDPLHEADGIKTASLLSLEYYQQLFDVNTDQVVNRIIWAMIPKPGVNYLQHHIGSKPDLYGPFWICVTLVFTIAISGNIANYFQTAASHNYHWKYDFHAVTFCASAIFSYAWIFPTILWTIIKWQGTSESQVGLIELLCVYGYSMSVYVPVSILWVIQIGWLQWLLVLIGAAMSGSVLVTAIWPAFKGRSVFLLATVLAFHLLLATGFMLYFFHASPAMNSGIKPSLQINNTVPFISPGPAVVPVPSKNITV